MSEKNPEKKKRSTAKGRFHRYYGRLLESIQDNTDTAVVNKILDDLEMSYVELEAKHEAYLETLDSDNEDDKTKVNQLNHDMTLMYKELCKSRTLCQEKMKRADKGRKTDDSNNSTKVHEHETFRVKKLDAPTFGGNLRDYPSFKVDYERHMVSSYGKDPYALKQCLNGEALHVVKGIDNDFDEMFKRLDLKYGRPERLVDNVLGELKKLKRIQEGENSKFVAMVETVEKCWLDLKRSNLESEMNTVTVVSQIEKLLPPLQKREWAILKQRNESSMFSSAGFRELLKFLLDEKSALEYMDSDLRDFGNTKVKIHSTILDKEDTDDENGNEKGAINALQQQMHESQNVMKQVVEGLAQVAQAVSKSDNRSGFVRNTQQERFTGNNRNLDKGKCWYHQSDNHDIGECTVFARLDNSTKIELLRKNGGCFSCLKLGHLSRRCNNRKPCEIIDTNSQPCGRMHHKFLHYVHIEGTSFHNSAQIVNDEGGRDGVLLMISSVQCKGQLLTTLWDPGANMSLITHKAARALGLSGKEITLSITKVGNVTEHIQSKEYVLELEDKGGETWTIRVYGMDEVTADVAYVDVSKVAKLFSGIEQKDIQRPTGKVDLLIGTDCCILMPNKEKQSGNLQLMKNQFGYCIRGSHALLDVPRTVNYGIVRIHWATGHTVHLSDTHIIESKGIKERLDTFFNSDGLGEQCTLKCGSCKCGKCVVGQSNHSLKEERELNLIKSGMKHDNETKQWTVKYPWIKDPNRLPNNLTSAGSRLKSTEKRLLRNGIEYAEAYDDQILDMLKRGIARKLSQDEIDGYQGPVHYIPHHEILKPESKSTPVRIVFNSSASFMGHTLNDYWAKGSNIMNDLLAVLIRFRQEQVALVGDISKMYNAVKLAPEDQHTHRFVWRNLETHREPDHYALLTVTFGDRPSGAIATLALRQTAEMYKTIYPKAAKMVIENSYVDDLLQSASSTQEALTIANNIEKMLAVGGFAIKHWIMSKTDSGKTTQEDVKTSTDEEKPNINLIESENEKILGMRWDPKLDVFEFKVKVNFSAKHRNVRIGNDISKEQVDDCVPENLTPRMVLSQVSSIYDPLGLVTPYTLKAKILLRKLFANRDKSDHSAGDTSHWDCPISAESRSEWIDFFRELFELETMTFQRCLRPTGSVGDPMLVIFSDGSNLAYGTCAYVRWELENGAFESRLVIAKNRIAPIKQQSIPRLELCGAVMGARVREKLEREMDYKFSRVMHIVDSTIVRAQIQRESYGFGTFVATRVAEIQNKTEPSEWWWVQSDQNVADLTTRVASPMDTVTNLFWKIGPDFLKLPISSWPIRQDCTMELKELPDTIGVAMTVDVSAIKEEKRTNVVCGAIQAENISTFRKLMKVTCIVMKVVKSKSFKGAAVTIGNEDMRLAEIEWIRYIQMDFGSDWRIRYQRLAPDLNQDGLIVVGKRLCDWLKFTWNKTEIVLLTNTHRFVRLYLKEIHDRDHAGVDVTLARSRGKFWIPGARRIIKTIKGQCIVCKKRDAPYNGQIMGNLPLERMLPSPPFAYCAVDLFGPFLIKDTVKGRSRGKAYGVLFNCMSSRAVYVDLAEGYDTSSFITVLRRFVSIRGFPKKMRSDSGSQLVAASKELKDYVRKWDIDMLRNFGKEGGMEWEFTKSADAPWENGCSESLIRSVKRSLILAIGQSVMTFSELQTVLFEVSNIVNERPIGTKTNDPNDGTYLCPNDLLLGRASITVPGGDFDESENHKKRWKFVQHVITSFWKKWQRDYFPSLIVRQKWHNKRRNICVGDIVMIHDNGHYRGKWKIGQVTEANSGRDGLVRDVTVRYKNTGCGSEYKGQIDTVVRRSAHRLVVLLPVEDQTVRN